MATTADESILARDSYAASANKNEEKSQYRIFLLDKVSRASSIIWNYFGLAEKENPNPEEKKSQSDRVVCLLCYNKSIIHVYMRSTSTGNLWRHLNKKHGIEIPKGKNLNNSLSINCISSFKLSSPKKRKLSSTTLNDQDSDVADEQICNETDNQIDFRQNLKKKIESLETDVRDLGSILITEVAKRPDLYLSGHVKKSTRELLWNEIYEATGKVVDVEQLQKIWKNIRDRYKKLKNKQGIFGKVTRYKYYDQLRFLDESDFIVKDDNANTNANTDNADTDTFNETSCYEDEAFLSDDSNSMDVKKVVKFEFSPVEIENKLSTSQQNISDDIEITNEEIITLEEPHNPIENRLIIQGQNQPIIEIEQSPNLMKSCNCDRQDEYDLFGKFIAEKLRKLSPSKSTDLEIKIMKMLKDEQ